MEPITGKEFLAKGKRSVVYTAKLGRRKVAVKEERAGSCAVNRMENEACWLERLNKVGIGPRFYFLGDSFVVMAYVPGERILDWIPKHGSREVKLVLGKVLAQCRELDRMQVNKGEMHNPYKHILVKGKKVVMIDFERCHCSESPKNVRQFCQFLMSRRLSLLLEGKGIFIDNGALINTLKEYRRDSSEKSFKAVLAHF